MNSNSNNSNTNNVMNTNFPYGFTNFTVAEN